jgi:hypothetical protein
MDLEPKEAIMIDLSEEMKLEKLEEIYQVKVESGRDPEYIEKLGKYLDSFKEPVQEKKTFMDSVLRIRNNNPKEGKIKDKEGAPT